MDGESGELTDKSLVAGHSVCPERRANVAKYDGAKVSREVVEPEGSRDQGQQNLEVRSVDYNFACILVVFAVY